MPHFSSFTAVVNGINLHYYRSGGDKPPIVLSHGITDDGLCWTPAAEALSANYDVILADTRGHGRSEAPADGYTLRALGLDLAGLITALQLDKPFVLGHSMGAIAALSLAGQFPDLPRALLLEDPPPFWMGQRSADSTRGFMLWIQSLKRKTHDDLLADLRSQNPNWAEAEIEPWINSKHRFSPAAAALIDPPDLVSIDFPALLGRICCPILFLSADPARGAASSAADIAKFREYLPQTEHAPIPQAGHNIRRDQFKLYMEAVGKFLSGL